MTPRLFGLVAAVLALAGCSPSGSAGLSPSPSAAPSCIFKVQSRFIDDRTPMVIKTDGVTAEECMAVVESDNNSDDWAKAHPEVILDVAPTESPLCSYVVFMRFWDRMARVTVWGDGLAGQNYCFTLHFEASHTPRPSN